MNNELMESFAVAAIRTGTVIDHIKAGNALKIVSLLELMKLPCQVTVGVRLPSQQLGHKDIIKIEGWHPDHEIHQVALYAPHATINLIRDYQVAEKLKVEIPHEIPINKRFRCSNARCISRVEIVQGNFRVIKSQQHITLHCSYCGKGTSLNEVSDVDN